MRSNQFFDKDLPKFCLWLLILNMNLSSQIFRAFDNLTQLSFKVIITSSFHNYLLEWNSLHNYLSFCIFWFSHFSSTSEIFQLSGSGRDIVDRPYRHWTLWKGAHCKRLKGRKRKWQTKWCYGGGKNVFKWRKGIDNTTMLTVYQII